MILFITVHNTKFDNDNSFTINGDYEELWKHIKKSVKTKQLNNSSYSVYYDIEYVINSYNAIKSDSFDFYIKIDYDDSIIDPLVDNIKDMVSEINKRLPQRQVSVEYHNTACFEKDFSQISLIKKYAQTIVDNCNKQLERISENYTKINY